MNNILNSKINKNLTQIVALYNSPLIDLEIIQKCRNQLMYKTRYILFSLNEKKIFNGSKWIDCDIFTNKIYGKFQESYFEYYWDII